MTRLTHGRVQSITALRTNDQPTNRICQRQDLRIRGNSVTPYTIAQPKMIHGSPCTRKPTYGARKVTRPTISLGCTGRASAAPLMSPLVICLLYTSDAADEEDSVDLGG